MKVPSFEFRVSGSELPKFQLPEVLAFASLPGVFLFINSKLETRNSKLRKC
jgi:hypothetical protein